MRIQIIFLLFIFSGVCRAQLGPPLGPPTLFTFDGGRAEGGAVDGVEQQLVFSTGKPLYKSETFSLISQLNYQNLRLIRSPLPSITNNEFQSVVFSLNANIQQESGNGWTLGGSFGSASDEIFTSSDVVTYSLLVQRKNKWSDSSSFFYGFFFSNNNALLPGLPIPTAAYEVQNIEAGSFYRIGFPLIIRQKNILPQTEWSLFAVGPVFWDVMVKNTSWQDYHFTIGANKRPETFLLANPMSSPLDQFMVEQIAVYGLVEFRRWSFGSLGLKMAYNFTNHFRLRETGTTRDDLDVDQRFSDYASIGISLKIFAPVKN